MAEVDALATAVISDTQTDFPAERALHNVLLCEAAYRSSAARKVVTLPGTG
jgi:hypothetical protein